MYHDIEVTKKSYNYRLTRSTQTRLGDLRSLKSAIASVNAWDGTPKKILGVNWVGKVIGGGGDCGVEILWWVGQGDQVSIT